MSFSGFSEEDIQKLNKIPESSNIKNVKGINKVPGKRVTFKSTTTTNPTRKKNLNHNYHNNIQAQHLPEEAKLNINEASGDCKVAITETTPSEEPVSDVPEQKFRDLDEFEARQKLMEEQNRKRKELLSKALADRTKRTQEEAQRLNEIQDEFKKLDVVLSRDVKFLRKQIELASIDYMECQKKYHKIEKEFLDVKLQLHKKKESKDMLTEHLCTIIEKNEERKAEKLTELLIKLEVGETSLNGEQEKVNITNSN